jgi:hypothetical protein
MGDAGNGRGAGQLQPDVVLSSLLYPAIDECHGERNMRPAGGPSPRLMLVEFNEIDPEYLLKMAEALGLQHLRRILSISRSSTSTNDRIEHHGLDPWVQWVGVHCGQPTEVHGIRRLGSTRTQLLPQLWTAIAAEGHTWGVWGAMNAPLLDRRGCKFFMPDPWSFDESAYPDDLNHLLALPRYTARNYLDIHYADALTAAIRLLRFLAPPKHWRLLARFATRALASLPTTGITIHALTTLLDYLSVLLFVKLRRDCRPDFSLIFLNNIAHLQHQFWTSGDTPHPEMRLGLQLSDAMMGLLLSDRQAGEALIVMNGLRQKNVAGHGFHVYRQRNPQRAIEALGVTGGRVEQNMTHDATIVFDTDADADHALDLLDRCRLSDGNKVFFAERQEDNRVFYQLPVEHNVAPDASIICGNYQRPFYEVFQLVCERTGAHVPEGDVFADGIALPGTLKNHEIFNHVLNIFRSPVSSAPLMRAAIAQPALP